MNRSIPIVVVRALSRVVATGITAQTVSVQAGTGERSARATWVRAAPADAYVRSTGVRPASRPALGTRSAAGLGLHDSPVLSPDQTKRAPQARLFLRGLASRAPYFHNGSARDLGAVVDFYDERFAIGFTKDERADLVAFLWTL